MVGWNKNCISIPDWILKSKPMTDRPEIKGDRILRSLARGFAALLLLLPVNSYALGLGDIELHSALNQPLDAEISLLSADSVIPDELKVSLASSDEFAKAELERPVYLTKIKFAIDHKADGRLYVKLTSEDVMKEPFIDFLIEVNWPDGRLVREYTVLLDPPVLVNDRPAPVEPATTGSSVQPQVKEPAPAVENMTQRTPAAPRTRDISPHIQTSAGKMRYGPVTRTDTLWSIASRLRPDNSVTVQQVMMALLKSNPEAFYNNNINELKAGYVLRIDDPDLITSMSAEEALQESRLQYQQWLDAKHNAGRMAGQRPVGSGESSGAMAETTTGESGAQLKLVAPDSGSTGSGTQGAATEQELDSLREKLAVIQENSDVTKQENDELRARISELEEQLASMQRLVTLKDDTMAAIQGNATQPGTQTQTTDAGAEKPAAQITMPEAPQQAQPAVTPPPPAKPKPAAPPSPPASQSALMMLLKDPVTSGLGVGVILIVLVLVWMKMRQRQLASDGFEEGILAAAESVGDDSDSAMADAVGGYAGEPAIDAIETDSDEMDVLAEADVYLAYRRFDKAIELLNGALQNEPDRTDYKLKLLEVYSESEDVDGFVAQAEEMYAAIGTEGGPVWDKVVQMGRRLTPDHPLFRTDGSQGDTGAESDISADSTDNADDDLALNFAGDLEGSHDEAASELASAEAIEDSFADLESMDTGTDEETANKLVDDALNFDLGGDEGETIAAADEEAVDELAENALDFDLGGDVGETGAAAIDDTGIDDVGEVPPVEGEPHEAGQQEAEAEDKSNVINFEASLSANSETGDVQEDETAQSGDFGNAIEFESGLATANSGETETAGEQVEEPVAQDLESDENALGFDLETTNDQPTGEEAAAVVEEDATADKAVGADDDLQWLSNIDDEVSLDDSTAGGSGETDDLISGGGDEVDTKLDLAKAYIDMDDKESARGILDEVVSEGTDDQKREAEVLIQQIG